MEAHFIILYFKGCLSLENGILATHCELNITCEITQLQYLPIRMSLREIHSDMYRTILLI